MALQVCNRANNFILTWNHAFSYDIFTTNQKVYMAYNYLRCCYSSATHAMTL